MKEELYKNTEIAAYFLWEQTRHSNALDLWYCAEDLCFFLYSRGITESASLKEILSLPKNDAGYIEFVRNIAYRIYIFTMEKDNVKNWYIAEALLKNTEWFNAIIQISRIYAKIREGESEIADSIRTERIRKLFWLFQE